MNTNKKISCVIPARLASTRFPQKVLAHLAGKPILQWIWQKAQSMEIFDEVVFAIDSEVTGNLIETFGGRYVMTSLECQSGTDRIVELYQNHKITGDVVVNWQGDSPLITKQMIDDLVQSVQNDSSDVWTLKKKIEDEKEVEALDIVKVVTDVGGNALYFSRNPIPCYRDIEDFKVQEYFKHIGLYAYSVKALQKIAQLSVSPLEHAEKLEQLRFLQHGLTIKVHQTKQDEIGINYPHDLVKAEKYLKQIV